MIRPRSTSKDNAPAAQDSDFREQILSMINAGLEETQTQHPLDVPTIFAHERPSFGDHVPIQLYRAVRLLGFREVLGAKVSSAILNISGRSVAQKMGIESMEEFKDALSELCMGNLVEMESNGSSTALTISECATCSGLPNIGEPVCHFETGFIAGALEGVYGEPMAAVETHCWCLGDQICRYEAHPIPDGSNGDQLDTLGLIMNLAGKASLAMENGLAIQQKNIELRGAYRKLREADRLKRDLTDMVVHDMRVPLTAVVGALETLSDLMGSKLSRQEETILKMAMSGGQVLVNMISDLLDVSKMEEGKLAFKMTPVAVDSMVEQSIKQIEILAIRKHLLVHTDTAPNLPEVLADRGYIIRLLLNLLSNAIHHTASGGLVTVSASPEPDGRMVRVSISDTGEGIPAEYHDRIFDKFVQVESHKSRKRYSTGLGLTFCKLVTEAHGGKIGVESEPGRGSTFSITIPNA